MLYELFFKFNVFINVNGIVWYVDWDELSIVCVVVMVVEDGVYFESIVVWRIYIIMLKKVGDIILFIEEFLMDD